MRKFGLTIGAALLAAGSMLAAPAQAAGGVKVGVLTCNVQSGWGYIVGSSKDMRCDFVPTAGRGGEHYDGTISKVGVDIGYTGGGVLVWDVIAPASDLRPGALEGGYGGVTAGATVGVGVAAHVLIGGFDKSITLQPVSVEGNTGLDVAAGIGAMNLKHAQG
jgi:hypothetical protein